MGVHARMNTILFWSFEGFFGVFGYRQSRTQPVTCSKLPRVLHVVYMHVLFTLVAKIVNENVQYEKTV